jgi:hypothetical protein
MISKKKCIKELSKQYIVSKSKHKPIDIQIEIDGHTYNCIFLKVNPQTQVTFNSPIMLELAQGKVDGLRFKKKSSRLIDLSVCKHKDNCLLFLLDTPYRTLKYINESDIIDVSNQDKVHHFRVLHSKEELKNL